MSITRKELDATGIKGPLSKVRAARQVLKERALDLLNKYEAIIDKAVEAGQLDIAAEHIQWLIEHTGNEDGERIIDPSASKVKEVDSNRGPTIQIGIALSGPAPKQLGPIVEAEVIPNDK